MPPESVEAMLQGAVPGLHLVPGSPAGEAPGKIQGLEGGRVPGPAVDVDVRGAVHASKGGPEELPGMEDAPAFREGDVDHLMRLGIDGGPEIVPFQASVAVVEVDQGFVHGQFLVVADRFLPEQVRRSALPAAHRRGADGFGQLGDQGGGVPAAEPVVVQQQGQGAGPRRSALPVENLMRLKQGFHGAEQGRLLVVRHRFPARLTFP